MRIFRYIIIRYWAVIPVVLMALAVPFFVSTVSAQSCPPKLPYWPGSSCPLLPCQGGASSTSCKNLCQLLELGQRLSFFGITIAVFILAPIYAVWGGVMIVIARGQPEGLGRGKKILWSALIGATLALGAFLIVNTFFWVLGLLNEASGQGGFYGSTWPTIQCIP